MSWLRSRGRHRRTTEPTYRPAFSYRPSTYPIPLVEIWETCRRGKGALPLRSQAAGTGLTFPGFHSGDFVYLSVQNENPTGVVTCRIVVDGSTVSENTSTGGYVIATCSGRVP